MKSSRTEKFAPLSGAATVLLLIEEPYSVICLGERINP